ncbi:MAG: undecaprenyl phosphate translocase family protein [Bacillota bacterium]
MFSVAKGLLLGLIMVLPGMSGGTVFVILGMYEDMIKDIVKLNVRPYLPLFIGILGGLFIGGNAFAIFFQSYRDITSTFLLGALLASVRSVVDGKIQWKARYILMLVIGIFIGYFSAGESISTLSSSIEENFFVLFIGGALASATMIIPGVPGSSVLFILNIYDTMLLSIKEFHIFNLSVFGAGSIVGILLLANALEKVYAKHRVSLSYLFVGLIIGSARTLLPHMVNVDIILTFIVAFSIVWNLSTYSFDDV